MSSRRISDESIEELLKLYALDVEDGDNDCIGDGMANLAEDLKDARAEVEKHKATALRYFLAIGDINEITNSVSVMSIITKALKDD